MQVPRSNRGCTGLQSTGGALMAGPVPSGHGGLAPERAIGVGFVVIKGATEDATTSSKAGGAAAPTHAAPSGLTLSYAPLRVVSSDFSAQSEGGSYAQPVKYTVHSCHARSEDRAPQCVKRCCGSRGRPTHRGCSRVRQCLLASILHAAPLLTAYNEATGVYVQRLEAACQLLHLKLQPSSIAAAQTASPCPSTYSALSAASPTSSAAGNTAAEELCTLLLIDQEVLDMVLALHDIRTAQLSNLLPSTRARLPPPALSGAFARRLSQRQRSASSDQLNLFVEALERDTIVELLNLFAPLALWSCSGGVQQSWRTSVPGVPMQGDPLLYVWDSMHRAMLLQLEGVDQHLTRLHATLPGLLLGLSTSVTVMQAAGHPDAQAHRLLLLRCIMHLGPLQSRIIVLDVRDHCQDVATYPTDKVTTYPDHLAHLLASSPAVTGWPGSPPAKPSYEHSYSTAGASAGPRPEWQGAQHRKSHGPGICQHLRPCGPGAVCSPGAAEGGAHHHTASLHVPGRR
ncbi:hypothetical protein HaLaN_00767 [Haematococcus lacustris]|uniref:Uncharacterized protein n=1 Tax=Haematococcus lacustris TaxID=44745 RepID=A0A699Y7M0_HAELA|nr:hypothetical protein HaLaN_00767 [Haematococcus lacustris]